MIDQSVRKGLASRRMCITATTSGDRNMIDFEKFVTHDGIAVVKVNG